MIPRKGIVVLTLAMASAIIPGFGSDVAAQATQAAPNQGLAAIDRAASANRYLFIFFYGQEDPRTLSLGRVFNDAGRSLSARADTIAISVNNPSESGIVSRFGVSKAPMPLVLVLAPNGAVVASFPTDFTREQLIGAFGTPGTERLLGALQRGKLVLLCVQNGRTRGNTEAMSGVRAFKADQRYAEATEMLMLDPNAAAERPLFAKLGMSAPVEEATTILMAPPGTIVGSFKGATDKNQIIKTLTSAISSCAAGCQPGGQCCPPAK